MPVNTAALLRTIKSARLGDIQLRLIDVASRWMAAGCVRQANRVLSVLRETGDLSPFSNLLPDFEIPWFLTGSRPDGWPASEWGIRAIERNLWTGLFGSQWSEAAVDRVGRADPQRLQGRRLVIRAATTAYAAYDEDRPDHVADPGKLAEAAALLDRFLASNSPDAVGYTLFQALTCRAILAARLGDLDGAKAYLVRWAGGCNEYPENWAVGRPLRDRTLAAILLSGVLAPVWQITLGECDADAEVIEHAVRERLASGRQLAFGSLGWTQLLKQLSDAVLQRDHEVQDLLRDPATPEEIEAAEVRLGIALPESYRGFLEASNGFGMYDIISGVEMLPVERIAWLRDADAALLDTYAQLGDLVELTEKLRQSLLIGRDPHSAHSEQYLLLVPPDDPAKEWECWFFAHWIPGEERHPTFRYFVESELNSDNP